jgi:phage gp36-like protein
MIDRFGSDELTALTDRTGAGVPDGTVVGRALDDASQVIDSYLASRYLLPLNPVPDQVGRWCCDIARFFLFKDEVSDAVKALYNASIASLKDAQAGRLTLETAAVDTPTTSGTAILAAPERVFDTRSLKGF